MVLATLFIPQETCYGHIGTIFLQKSGMMYSTRKLFCIFDASGSACACAKFSVAYSHTAHTRIFTGCAALAYKLRLCCACVFSIPKHTKVSCGMHFCHSTRNLLCVFCHSTRNLLSVFCHSTRKLLWQHRSYFLVEWRDAALFLTITIFLWNGQKYLYAAKKNRKTVVLQSARKCLWKKNISTFLHILRHLSARKHDLAENKVICIRKNVLKLIISTFLRQHSVVFRKIVSIKHVSTFLRRGSQKKNSFCKNNIQELRISQNC